MVSGHVISALLHEYRPIVSYITNMVYIVWGENMEVVHVVKTISCGKAFALLYLPFQKCDNTFKMTSLLSRKNFREILGSQLGNTNVSIYKSIYFTTINLPRNHVKYGHKFLG